jgi:predicted transcriptional regulator
MARILLFNTTDGRIEARINRGLRGAERRYFATREEAEQFAGPTDIVVNRLDEMAEEFERIERFNRDAYTG